MQCACAILSSVACRAVPYISTLSYKQLIFGEKYTCVSIFFSEIFLILRRIQRNVTINAHSRRYACKVHGILVGF
jgi:hypothetical protein